MVKNNNEVSYYENYLSCNIIDFDDNVLEEIKLQKRYFIENNQETQANLFWMFEQIYILKKSYVDSYKKIKEKKYEETWRLLDQVDIMIGTVKNNFENSYLEKFKLDEILFLVREFQKLFPYSLFASREMVILEESCSICHKPILLRSKCNHIPGKIYNGEMCCRIVEKADLVAIALVKNPEDKYAIIKLDGQEYNYTLLDTFINNIKGPYDFFYVKESEVLKPEFLNLKRKSLCLCGSGKKYKHCCLKNGNDKMLNKTIVLNHPCKDMNKVFNI